MQNVKQKKTMVAMDLKQNDEEKVVAGAGAGGSGNSSEEMKRREALVRPGHGDRPPWSGRAEVKEYVKRWMKKNTEYEVEWKIFWQESWERSRNKNYRIMAVDGTMLAGLLVSLYGILSITTVSESTRVELTGPAANRRAVIYRKSQKNTPA